MEENDTTNYLDNAIPDEEMMLQEVIQGDADLYYLHHFLTEIFRKGDIF